MQGCEAEEQDYDPDRLQLRLAGTLSPQFAPPSRQAADDCFLDFPNDGVRQEMVCLDVLQNTALTAARMCVCACATLIAWTVAHIHKTARLPLVGVAAARPEHAKPGRKECTAQRHDRVLSVAKG